MSAANINRRNEMSLVECQLPLILELNRVTQNSKHQFHTTLKKNASGLVKKGQQYLGSLTKNPSHLVKWGSRKKESPNKNALCKIESEQHARINKRIQNDPVKQGQLIELSFPNKKKIESPIEKENLNKNKDKQVNPVDFGKKGQLKSYQDSK